MGAEKLVGGGVGWGGAKGLLGGERDGGVHGTEGIGTYS